MLHQKKLILQLKSTTWQSKMTKMRQKSILTFRSMSMKSLNISFLIDFRCSRITKIASKTSSASFFWINYYSIYRRDDTWLRLKNKVWISFSTKWDVWSKFHEKVWENCSLITFLIWYSCYIVRSSLRERRKLNLSELWTFVTDSTNDDAKSTKLFKRVSLNIKIVMRDYALYVWIELSTDRYSVITSFATFVYNVS